MSVDAPGWAEHMSLRNRVYCFTNPQPFSVSSSLTHLDCCPHCGSEEDVAELCLKDYPSLESIHIGSYSFPHILSVEVRHLPRLKQFVVENHCFLQFFTANMGMVCRVEDCSLLESISIGTGSFHFYNTLALKGDEFSYEMNTRSSSSEVVMCGN